LGQYLKRERESRSVSLEELSKGTRISLPYLEALESDYFHFFSKREYLQGFLKGYARHLGLEVNEVLRRYRIQSELLGRQETFQQLPLFSNSNPPPEEVPEPEKVPKSLPSLKINKRPYPRVFLQVTIVLAAVGLTLYFQHLLKEKEDADKRPATEHLLPHQKGADKEGKELGVGSYSKTPKKEVMDLPQKQVRPDENSKKPALEKEVSANGRGEKGKI